MTKPTRFPNGIEGPILNAPVTDLTDDSGGTASDTIAAIGGSYNQAQIRNAIASLAAKINDLNAAVRGN